MTKKIIVKEIVLIKKMGVKKILVIFWVKEMVWVKKFSAKTFAVTKKFGV